VEADLIMADNSHQGNANKATVGTGGTVKPAGQELSTVKNANLAHQGNANLAH
jgi:hypothetical protein